MQTKHRLTASLAAALLVSPLWAETPAATEKTIAAPHGQTIAVKMIGPVTQTTDLQIICVLKHDPAGDKYIEAMVDFNDKLGKLLSALRDRGEFAGDLGETLLFTPPAGTIAPKRVLLIGAGAEADLSLEKLNEVGRIAAREAVRLKAATVSFAPTMRDQGSTRIDVGDGDAAFASGWVAAYDTEARLQAQRLAEPFDVISLTIEAGPKFFVGAFDHVSAAVQTSAAELNKRDASSYSQAK